MIYANDQWMQLPTVDLYDTQMMAMAINAARDMYEKGLQLIKDFVKEYGDFYSPIPGRTQEVYNETLGRVKNTIDAIYAAGGDPLRSPEAMAIIGRTINSANVGKVNQYRQEANIASEYIKNRERAKMEGWYNEDLEKYLNRGKTLELWGPSDGIWTSAAPSRYMTQDDIISPLAKALNPEFDPIRTAKENDGYDYKTVSEDRIRKMVRDNIDDLIGNGTIGKYYYKKALDEAKQDPELAKWILTEQYVKAAKKNTKEDRELNQFKYQKMLADERRKAAREEAALQYQYKQLENWDFDGDGKIDADELDAKRRYKEAQIEHYKNIGKPRDDDKYPNIFREADDKPGEYVEFDKEHIYENKISPASGKITRVGKVYDDNGKETNYPNFYDIHSGDMKDLIENKDIIPVDESHKLSVPVGVSSEYRFVADGYIVKKPIYKRNKNGKYIAGYSYYMSGDLYNFDTSGLARSYIPKNGKTPTVLVRINERNANYGKQQEKDKSVGTTN